MAEATAGFDVYLSHTSTDKAAVRALARALQDRGLTPWLDVEQVVPGVRFQTELGAGLAASRCFAVFVGAGTVGSWVPEELDAAIARAAGDRSFRVFVVLLPTAPRHFDATQLHPFLSLRTWVDLRDVDDERAGDLLARAVRGEPLVAMVGTERDGRDDVCPYVGLRAFDLDDVGWFFGRDADVQRLAEILRSSPFVAVLGRSGSGKSSLVRAGLLGALRAGGLVEGSERWAVRVLRPTDAPLEALAGQLGLLRPDVPVARLLGDLGSADAALAMLLAPVDQDVVFVVDQAEELYTLCDDDEARRAFVANLLHAARPGGGVRVVVTLRSDFYPRFAELETFCAGIAAHQHVVTDMGPAQLEDVITQPAGRAGLELEAGLVERVLRDVQGQAGALPLLEDALRELWGSRRGSVLTHEAYAAIGGVEGALAQRADEVFAALDERGDGPVVRYLALELTQLGEGVEDTLRPVRLDRLASPSYTPEALHRVAAALADARLVTTGTDDEGSAVWVELTHEALIGSWPRLRAWIDAGRDDLRARRRVQDAATAWDDQGRPDGLLYRDLPLATAEERFHGRDDEMTALETDFLTASSRHEQADRRRARRARGLALGAPVIALLVVVWTLNRLYQEAQRTLERTEQSVAVALARQAEATAERDPALGVALAAEAMARRPTADVAGALQVAHLAYSRTPGHYMGHIPGPSERPWEVMAFDHTGRTLAVDGSEPGEVDLLDPRTGKSAGALQLHDAQVEDMAFSPDERHLATAGSDGTVVLHDVDTGEDVTVLEHQGKATPLAVAFDDTGTLLAFVWGDETVRIWDDVAQQERPPLRAEDPDDLENGFLDVAFSTDGSRLAAVDEAGVVTVWDVASGRHLLRLGAYQGAADESAVLAFSPSGDLIAASRPSGEVLLWNLATRQPSAQLKLHGRRIEALAFRPDGKVIAASSGVTGLWDVATGQELALLDPPGGTRALAFSPTADLLVTANGAGGATTWDPTVGDEVMAFSTGAPAEGAIALDPSGATTAVYGPGFGNPELWDNHRGRHRARLTGKTEVELFGLAPGGSPALLHDPWVGTVLVDVDTGEHLRRLDLETSPGAAAFSQDGALVATLEEATVHVWDVRSGDRTSSISPPEGLVAALALSPDRSLVASGAWVDPEADSYGSARLWDVATGKQVAFLDHGDRSVEVIEFSPDGHTLATVNGSDLGDAIATLWDVDSHEKLVDLDPGDTVDEDDEVTAVAFSPDGDTIATGNWNGTTTLWARDGRRLTTLEDHSAPILDLAFDADGRLISLDVDGNVSNHHLVLTTTAACRLITGDVTRAELVAALGGNDPEACTDLR